MRIAGAARRERGFALVIVLATLALLAVLIARLSVVGRDRLTMAEAATGNAMLRAAADGALHRAIFELRAGVWTPDGPARQLPIGRAMVTLRFEDQSDRFNPNFSGPPLLAALLGELGVDPARATALARRMVDWRTATPYAIGGGMKLDAYRQAGLPYGPPNGPYLSVDEVALVPGMPTDLAARLRPLLSVYQSGEPKPTEGPGRSALRDAEMINHASVLSGFRGDWLVVAIRASAMLANHARFTRTAVLRMARGGGGAAQVLAWE